MTRRRLTEREVIAVLLQQGAAIKCPRCGQYFMLDEEFDREHHHELALGGADEIGNMLYSHRDCHAAVTNGNRFNRTGSSKAKIAKANRCAGGKLKPYKVEVRRKLADGSLGPPIPMPKDDHPALKPTKPKRKWKPRPPKILRPR